MRNSVLIVGSFLDSAPIDRYVSGDLAGRLSGRRWGVSLTSRSRHRLARFADMLKTTWEKRGDYEVALVDVFSGPAFGWAEAVCWLLRRLGKPFALTLHGGNLPAFSRRWPRRVRRLLASAAVVTTPSAYLLEQMQPYRSGLRLLPNPIDLLKYEYRVRAEPRPELVWLRAFHEIYNPSLAPRVLAELVDSFPGARLTMVGPDKGDGSLPRARSTIDNCGVADAVVLAGPVHKSEIPAVLNRGDVFLNTTNCDNAPVSVIEAMASGLCIVSTDVGGIPYLLRDGHDALLVRPDDPSAMAAAVRRILTEPGLAERLSGNARRKAEEFDWRNILPQWEKLLTEVGACAGRRPIHCASQSAG